MECTTAAAPWRGADLLLPFCVVDCVARQLCFLLNAHAKGALPWPSRFVLL